MKRWYNPPRPMWGTLVKRPVIDTQNLDEKVMQILEDVKNEGDRALQHYTLKFDHIHLEHFRISHKEIEDARKMVPNGLKTAIDTAAANIKKFHSSQLPADPVIETMKGVNCWRQKVAIEQVGLYIPGGSAPLFSSILMLGIPALIAGCSRIVLCTPSSADGTVHPAILYTASYLGIYEIYKVGGAQAIAAMAYGTESIPKVDKVFGPGNQYVTKAKELIQKAGIPIDLPAGPSEVLIIADSYADADFIAADLLSQAEHGADSQVVLLTDTEEMLNSIDESLKKQLQKLPRASIAARALKNSFSVYFSSIAECIEFSNAYAPEHLIMAVEDAQQYCPQILHAGSVFLGRYSCESAGDYASGTNHTLPTNGYARSYSGVSTDSYIKRISFQEITEEGLLNIGNTIEIMAEAEALEAHKNAVSIRLKKIKNEE